MNQQMQAPSAMLMLRTEKQNEMDLKRAIEESKRDAGLPNDIEMLDQ